MIVPKEKQDWAQLWTQTVSLESRWQGTGIKDGEDVVRTIGYDDTERQQSLDDGEKCTAGSCELLCTTENMHSTIEGIISHTTE